MSDEKEVLCKAIGWGRTEDSEAKEVKQYFGSLLQAMIVYCSSQEHVGCSMFKKEKM